MNTLNRTPEISLNLDALSIQELLHLYGGTVDELRHCAAFVPDGGPDDATQEAREQSLLGLEASILSQAAAVKVDSKDDVLKLMDIWGKVAEIDVTDDLSCSNRIAMNIFRHMNGAGFFKE